MLLNKEDEYNIRIPVLADFTSSFDFIFLPKPSVYHFMVGDKSEIGIK